jgi:phage tail-like protein
MAQFPVNPTRHDPYKNYKFRVKWDGRYIAGISAVGPLRRTTEIVEHREGGDPSGFRKSPGLTRYDPITLQRGVTQDRAFEDWANLVWKLGAPLGGESALAGLRKDMHIELLNEAGQVVLAYIVHRAWVCEYTALPDLDANANAVVIQSITLAHEGWERDTSVAEPVEPKTD